MSERKWWLDPNEQELQAVQFALRMTAKHPWLTTEQAKEYTDLADALWEGHFCQPLGESNGPFYEDGDGWIEQVGTEVIHTIPVPQGWSAEQAWEAIQRGDDLTDKRPRWANVRIKNGRFVDLLDA